MYQLSPYLQVISDDQSDKTMLYHALYGNPRVVNQEGLRFLELFQRPTAVEEIIAACDGDPSGIIREFAEICFLIEPGFDEKQYLRERKAQHLEKVAATQTIDRMGLAISDNCNFGCTHCLHFQPMNGQVLPIYQQPKNQLNMKWETAKSCIDRVVALLRQNGRNTCKLHFGNAEPLMNWPVIQTVLEYCASMSDMQFTFAINTNLVLVTREIAETLKRYRVDIATSLDGNEAANDAIRITKGGRGTYQRI